MKNYCFLLILMKASILFAQPGSLDNSFGAGGIAFSPFVTQYSYEHALALQPDGKILVTGHRDVTNHYRIFVVRYNPDGSFDSSFPTVVTSIGSSFELAKAIAVQNDGKIVVAGHLTNGPFDFLVFRLTSSGVFDSTFGTAGIVTTSFTANSSEETNAMVIQSDGKILIAGWTSTTHKDIALLRFNTDGTLDATFGAGGKVSTDLNNTNQEAHDIALQPDGKIVVAGFSQSTQTANDVAVFRYHTDGSPDVSFGTNGVSIPVVNATDDDAAWSMELQPDGKIVTAGYTYTTSYTYADNLVVRFDSAGNLDSGFNGTGSVISNSTGSDNISYDMVLQSDEKIVIIGRSFHPVTFDFLLSRFNSNGSVDPSFGNGGHVYTAIGIEDDLPLAALIQPDGKIVVTGYYTDSGIENYLVARYLNDISLSINYENHSTGVLLYPQPASDFIHVTLNKEVSSETTAGIYSINSELLRTVRAENEFSIETADLLPGVYFLRITDAENRMVAARTVVKD